MENSLQGSLDDVTCRVRVTRRRKNAIARELASHVADARHDLVLSGWKAEDADREALIRLGDPQDLADAFTVVHRPSRRAQFGMAAALATGMILGVYGIGGSFASARAVRSAPHHHVIYVGRGHRSHR
jgi:hypothetical protein